jgi:hypothetical protein
VTFWAYFLELYPKSVFFGRYRSVFFGITNTNTREYLGRYGTFGIKILAGHPQKNGGSPLFSKKGGLRPPFCIFHPPFEEKKEFPHNFFLKKSSREIFKRCSRQNLQHKNTDRKNRNSSKSDTSRILIPKKLLVTPWYTTLLFSIQPIII